MTPRMFFCMAQSFQEKNRIAIVGAGPAGVYCAINILENFSKLGFGDYFLTIFDKSQALRTILPTGNGRCNITNSIYDIDEFIENYPRGKKFLYSLFSRHFNYDSLEFFSSIGIDCYTQDDGRIFPKSNSAKDVKDKMLSALNRYKQFKLVNKKINSQDELASYTHIIVAAGSRETDDLIKTFKHKLIPFKKALCALGVENFNFPKGISIKSLDGDFVTTHNGISGPLAFKISSLNAYEKYPYVVNIRLFDINDALLEISINTKKSIGNVLSKFIPKSFLHVPTSG